jgi:RNA polymerase sigma factor (TIGR02999 family)
MDSMAAQLAPVAERAWTGERAQRDHLFAALYDELHRLARREARRFGPIGTIGATTLLHEAYLDISLREALVFPDAARFMAYASRTMRGLVIDRFRERGALKRGGDLAITSLDTQTAAELQDPDPDRLVEISDALDELAALDPALAQVVDLRFFCGFSMADIALQLGVSERTVQRQWEKARVLLYRTLSLASNDAA